MNYLKIKNVTPNMVLARPIIDDAGKVLMSAQAKITETSLERLKTMGYQGAYVDLPAFSDIYVEDSISHEIRTKAFDIITKWDMDAAVGIASQIVEELRQKDTLTLDLLDIKSDNNYIIRHSISVAIFASVIGISCGLKNDQVEQLAVAGLLHDIGMTQVSETVTGSKLVFDSSDMDEMMKHPMLSYEITKGCARVSSVSRNAILFHHENLDGTGYYKESPERIGQYARIIRIADTYDSLTSKKPYRDAWSPAQAIEYLMANSGNLFDPELVQIFIKKVPIYPIGFTVKLSNGELAVISNNHINSMRPEITLFTGRKIDLSQDPDYRSVTIKEFA